MDLSLGKTQMRFKSRLLKISTIVVWTRKNEIPQTFSDEWSIYVIHINITKNKKNKRGKKNTKTTFDGRQRMMVPRYPACTLSLPGCERAGFKKERAACLIHDP